MRDIFGINSFLNLMMILLLGGCFDREPADRWPNVQLKRYAGNEYFIKFGPGRGKYCINSSDLNKNEDLYIYDMDEEGIDQKESDESLSDYFSHSSREILYVEPHDEIPIYLNKKGKSTFYSIRMANCNDIFRKDIFKVKILSVRIN